jgi:Tfp pilus assembly protein PilO
MPSLPSRSPAKKTEPVSSPKAPAGPPEKSLPAAKPGVKGRNPEKAKQPKKVKSLKKPKRFSIPSLAWRGAIAGAMGMVLIGGSLFASSQLKILTGQVREKKSQLIVLSQEGANLQQLKEALITLEAEEAVIQSALIKEDDVIDFLGEIQGLEAQSEVQVINFNFANDEPRQDPNGYSYIEFSLEAVGTVDQVKNFLEKILGLPLLIKTKSIDISDMETGTGRLIFKAWLYVDPEYSKEAE